MRDSFTPTGAESLAAQIKEYWRGRGFSGIEVKVEPVRGYVAELGRTAAFYQVRSNIGPTGFPPRQVKQLAA